jgi:hypothetical protein
MEVGLGRQPEGSYVQRNLGITKGRFSTLWLLVLSFHNKVQVRLGGYKVNLCDFYFDSPIWKLTLFYSFRSSTSLSDRDQTAVLKKHNRWLKASDSIVGETANDKIRKYHSDNNNNPSNGVAFMPTITGTNGRLHSDCIRLLFLQAHRETDRFFFLQFQEFSQRNQTWELRTSTFTVCRSWIILSQNVDYYS